jgi:hypothetical protein
MSGEKLSYHQSHQSPKSFSVVILILKGTSLYSLRGHDDGMGGIPTAALGGGLPVWFLD